MATKQSTVDFILEQISPPAFVSAKKMFGEYALYADDKVIALVCDEQLFVKITNEGKAFLGNCEEGRPYPGAKACFLIAGESWEDREWLSELLRITAENLAGQPGRSSARQSKTRDVVSQKFTKSKPARNQSHDLRCEAIPFSERNELEKIT